MYATAHNDQALTFTVRGVYRRNMVIRDNETGTIWQHATGEGVAGPLRGERLTPLGGEMTRWGAWREAHPTTTLAYETPDTPTGLLPTERMVRLFRLTNVFATPGKQGYDRRLPMHEEILGIALAGEALAFPLAAIRESGVINAVVGGVPVAVVHTPGDAYRAFKRQFGGEVLSLQRDGDCLHEVDGSRIWQLDGSPENAKAALDAMPISRQWWLGWSEFYPQTDVFA